MCPFVLLALILSLLLVVFELTAAISVSFRPTEVKQLKEGETISVSIEFDSQNKFNTSSGYYELYISDNSIVDIVGNKTIILPDYPIYRTFELKGKFLGHTWLQVVKKLNNVNNNSNSNSIDVNEKNPKLAISVVRPMSQITKIFTISVAVLVSINYINMGCALDLNVVFSVLKRPIAPAIGFICQYTFMPLVNNFIIHYLLFYVIVFLFI